MVVTENTPLTEGDHQVSPMVEVTGLRKVYKSRKRGEVVAVDDVSFSVGRNEIVGLLGPNGAGKTTTIKCVCTLITPSAGRVLIDGVDALREPRRAVAGVAAVLEGNRNIYWRLTSKENLELFAGLNGIPARRVRPLISELIEQFHLEDKMTAEARTLSRGMQQKLAVACAFVKETPLLLLDEPTLGLDVETSYELRESLKRMAGEGQRTILLSSHDMDVVQAICERVIIVSEGRILADDSVANLLDLFRVRSYRFKLLGPIGEATKRDIFDAFPGVSLQSEAHESSIDVELVDGKQIYQLLDLLRASGASIETIDRSDPNLEDIFLRIVKGERRR